jgi:molybdate transport system ATP-binding protein
MSFDIAITGQIGTTPIAVQINAPGGTAALFGPSGAGKTSILNMIAGLIRPATGHIRINGETLFDADARINLPPEARRAGYVFQDGRLFPHMNVRENLTYGLSRATPDQRWMTLDEATGFLGITTLLDRRPRTLSGGEAQRVAIGRALLSAPRFLLMDEPLASLDAARRGEILAVLERIRDELKLPILFVSHDRTEVERLAGLIVAVGG